MPNIVAGSFEDRVAADRAIRSLADAGFADESLVSLTVPAQGQRFRPGRGGSSRPGAVLVAVHAPEPQAQECALITLVSAGAGSIETADGTWRDGQWIDFDPVAATEPADQPRPPRRREALP
jgi:hypothetical protein